MIEEQNYLIKLRRMQAEEMSIRAAVGIFYGAVSGQAVDSSTNGQPFSIRQQFNNLKALLRLNDLP